MKISNAQIDNLPWDEFSKFVETIFGIALFDNAVQKLKIYLQELIKWNNDINLVSFSSLEEVLWRHFADSLSALALINKYCPPDLQKPYIIDIGTGAGFPGIPIKIMIPSIKLTLLESQKKKTMFLIDLVEKLELKGIDIVKDRAEIIGKKEEFREVFDICIARAVAPFNILYEYTLPLIKKNGWFIAMKGKEYEKNFKESINVLNLLGGKLFRIDQIQLPILNQKRNIVVIKKVKNTPENIPRRVGLPKKRPLNI